MLPEIGVVLDAGTGMFRVRDLIQTDSLAIFVTHAHLDHSIGLTFLFDVVRETNVRNVRVYAEPTKIDALRGHLFHEQLFPVMPPIDFRPLAADRPVELPGGGGLIAIPLEHPCGSVGFRLDWPGHSMAYITDTTADLDAGYVAKIRQVDLLVHECYFPDGEEERARITGHSCLTPVVEVARQAQVKRLALVHTNPLDLELKMLDLEAARKIFSNIVLPNDGDSVEF